MEQTLAQDAPEEDLLHQLELRLGADHARRRLTIEQTRKVRTFGGGLTFFHPENWLSLQFMIRVSLRLAGMHGRGQANGRRHRMVDNRLVLPDLPPAFEGYRILHLTDLHVDMDELALQVLLERVRDLDYDLCVLTGDYRRDTWGTIEPAMDGMRRLRDQLRGEVFAVLGNHDSIRMLPEMEAMGYRLLMNENTAVERNGEQLWLAGVDDAHYYQVDDLRQAGEGIPAGATTVLLSHTPEIYDRAAEMGYDVFLCGHTHGGQICLPGGIPLTLDADCPRFVGRGAWQYQGMQGYTSPGTGTSVVNVRFNCPPEITRHVLTRGPA
ncbi:metallophosphoesterase family protein [Marinobacteraceae bacterium S3BR75-40.1]